jgi:phosphomevalonate kinase
MKADAPGKLVLSGAYAVLRGAPAVVTAVNRRVFADTSRPPTYRAPEVKVGLDMRWHDKDPPFYDASALRSSDDKLGLGSSAAICVASLGALLAEEAPHLTEEKLREELYPLARKAHRIAQGGGSGIDVAAACFGGTLLTQLDPDDQEKPPRIEPLSLPHDLVIEVWGCPESSSTAQFVRRLFAQESENPREFKAALGLQHEASQRAAEALRAGNSADFVAALRSQEKALERLSDLAQLPIVPEGLRGLARDLEQNCAVLPSGAGGGDISLHVGPCPSSSTFRERAKADGLFLVPLELHAEGFRLLGSES